MGTLLLRLAAPQQSWGVDSKFETRRTEREPSKSGVIGMVAAALGRSREDSLDDLNELKFGVRVDKEGTLLVDFHTAHAQKCIYVTLKDNKKEDPYTTYRHYLQDAVFLVGLYSDNDEFLKKIEYALKNPVYHLYLGRRSCPPTLPLVLGIRDSGLLEALENEEWLVERYSEVKPSNADQTLRIVTEALDGEVPDGMINDKPISFSKKKRDYGYRSIKLRKSVKIGDKSTNTYETEHDPMAELR